MLILSYFIDSDVYWYLSKCCSMFLTTRTDQCMLTAILLEYRSHRQYKHWIFAEVFIDWAPKQFKFWFKSLVKRWIHRLVFYKRLFVCLLRIDRHAFQCVKCANCMKDDGWELKKFEYDVIWRIVCTINITFRLISCSVVDTSEMAIS